MRKLLFILSALILTGGGLSAQSHGHRQHALKENGAKGATELRESPKENPRIKALKQRAENRKAKPAKSGNSIFKANASKDGGPVDYLLSVIPGPENPYITFSFDDCGQTQTKQLVVKNTTDEPVDAILISEYPYVDLKRVVFGSYLEDASVVNGYLYGWSYNYDEHDYEYVKINLETGVVEVISGDFWDFTTCGGTIWAASWDGEYSIVALDDNLEPTGFSFTVGDEWFDYGRLSSDGENLLVYGYNYDVMKFRVMAYNTSGELVADYGEFDAPYSEMFVCDPATRTFWIASVEYVLGIQINNGKLEVADIVSPYYMEDNRLTHMAFGENGECYYYIYSYESDREYIMEGSRMQPFGKGVSLSPAKLSLQPGEQTTVNITANASAGSYMAMIGAVATDFYDSGDFYFMRAIATQVNVEPEFEVYGDTVMTTFAGNQITGNVWLKNTGCQSIEFDDIDLKNYTDFGIVKPLLPPFFNGTINPGDSVGYVIGFYSESAGNFTDSLAFFIIKDETPSPIVVPLKGICEDVDYTIAKTEFDMEINECVETLAIDDTITNNTNLPMTVAIDNVKFKIHTGWSEECSMAWDLKDAHNNIIYSWPEDGFEYDSDYERDFLLPEGDYTLKLYGGGEFGWGDNCIDLTVNGKRLLSQASWSSSFNQFKFTAKEAWSTEVPAKSSIESIDVPLGLLTMPGYNYLKLIAQGVPDPVDTITLYTYGGQPDFSVVSSFDFGKISEYGQSTLVLTNNGCAPVSFKDVVFKYWSAGHRNYFNVWNEEAGEEKPYAGLDDIAPYSSVELPIYVYVDSIGEFRDTLLFSVEGQGKFEVVMTATGAGAPEASFSDTVIKDTVDYGTETLTVSKMVVNNGGSDLIITHPISISYNSGSKEYWNGFTLYSLTPNFAYDLYSLSDSWDVTKYYNLEPGNYAFVLEDWDDSPGTQDSYFTITNGGNTIVGKTMLKDLRESRVVGDFWDRHVKFTLTEDMYYRDTIAPGDSLALTMEIPLRNWVAGYYDEGDDGPFFSKTFYTNDPQNQEITLVAEVCVEGEMNIAVPKTIELGNVQVGTYGKQTVTITNTGGVPFNLEYIYITGSGSSSFDFTFTGEAFWPNWGEDLTIKFTPTATGLAEAQIAFVGQDSTLTIALKGTGVAPVEPVFSADTVRVTAECGQTEATAKFAVTNNSNSTMVFASHPRVMVYTGDGENPDKLRFSVWRLNEQGNAAVQCLLNKNAGFFTESGKTMEFELDLPVGHYKAVIEGKNGNTDRNTNATVEVVYNGEPLGYTRSVATNYYVDYFHVTESMNEITEVAANSTKELEFTYSLEGLTPGEYVYTKILDHNSVEHASDTLVTVVTIESKLDYAYSKDTVEFVPVHVGNDSYATVKIENTGCEDVNIIWEDADDFGFIDGTNFMATIGLRVASYMPAPLLNPADLNLEVGEVTPIYLVFTAERPGTYRDTLIITTSRGIDTIPVVATATATQVLEVSTPTADGYYRAGDTLAINVIFDALVDLDSTNSTGLPQLLMNTGGYAVLDTNNSDGYTLRFLYPIAETDNIEKLAIEAIEWNGVKVMDGDTEITIDTLPANNEFAGSAIALDNTAPTFAVSTSATVTSATLTVVFSEEITGFAGSDITLSNDAAIADFATDDNKTFVAELTLQHAVATNISIAAEVADLAGNTLQLAWTGSVVTVHDYDTTVVEPTFDNVGYKKLVCKICGETIYIDTVPALEVKVVAIALTKKPNKLNYAAGEVIDLSGAQLTLTFNNGETKVIDLTLAMISGFDVNATGKQTITVTYKDGGETFTATFDIEIEKAEEGSAVAEEAAAAVSIYSFDNTIVVEAEADGSEIAVFDLNGRMVAKALATGSRTEIEMSVAGIYVVRVGNTAERVAVK